MIPRECPRLAEVDFPLAQVSRQVSEKASPKGYPFMLHLWWARRPLGACRAMLLALLLPDPVHPSCPVEFRKNARAALREVRMVGDRNEDLREALLWFVGANASWELA